MKTFKRFFSKKKKYHNWLSYPIFSIGLILIFAGRIEGLLLWFLASFSLQKPKVYFISWTTIGGGLFFGLVPLQVGNNPTGYILIGAIIGAISGLATTKILGVIAPKTFS